MYPFWFVIEPFINFSLPYLAGLSNPNKLLVLPSARHHLAHPSFSLEYSFHIVMDLVPQWSCLNLGRLLLQILILNLSHWYFYIPKLRKTFHLLFDNQFVCVRILT